MEICRKMAGYSYGRADIVRRAMAKKKHDVMLKERESFVSGSIANGISEEIANDIFDEMVSFASYAFNKSHAAAYSYLAFQTAYLKYYYYKEYMSSLMSSVMSNTGKLLEYISECKIKGVNVIKPDVNKSMIGFSCCDSDIYFGLQAIKNCGRGLVEKIVYERQENGKYKDIYDFLERIECRELNKRALENLIKSGALDNLGLNRHQLMDNYEELLSASTQNDNNVEGQLNFLDEADTSSYRARIPYEPEYQLSYLLNMEKEATGMYLSGNPLQEHIYIKKLLRCPEIRKVTSEESLYKDGEKVSVLCSAQSVKLHITKNGSKMAFVTVEDETGELDVVVFPDLYAVMASRIQNDAVLFIKGKISHKDSAVSLICDSIYSKAEFPQMISSMKLCVKIRSNMTDVMNDIINLSKKYTGDTVLCFYIEDLHKYIVPKNKQTVCVNEEYFKKLTELIQPDKTGLI